MALRDPDTSNASPLFLSFYQKLLMKKKFIQILSLGVICCVLITVLYRTAFASEVAEEEPEESACVNVGAEPQHFCFDVSPLMRDVRKFAHFVQGSFKYEFSFGSHQIPLQVEFERTVRIIIGCLPLMKNTTETLNVIFGLDHLTVNGKRIQATVPESLAFGCANNVPRHQCSRWWGAFYFRKGFEMEYLFQANATSCRVRPMVSIAKRKDPTLFKLLLGLV